MAKLADTVFIKKKRIDLEIKNFLKNRLDFGLGDFFLWDKKFFRNPILIIWLVIVIQVCYIDNKHLDNLLQRRKKERVGL